MIAIEDDLAKLKLRRAGLFMFSCVLDLLFKVFELSFTNWKMFLKVPPGAKGPNQPKDSWCRARGPSEKVRCGGPLRNLKEHF